MPIINPIPVTSSIEPMAIALEVEDLLQSDLTSMQTKLDNISSGLNGLEVNVDLTPIQSKLTTIEQKIDALSGTSSSFTPEIEYLRYLSHYWIDANDLPNVAVNTELTSWQEANGKLGTGAFTLRQSPNGIKWGNFPSGKYITFALRQRDFNYFDIFVISRRRSSAYNWLLGDFASNKHFAYLSHPPSASAYSYLYFAESPYITTQSFNFNTWILEHIRFGGLMASTKITRYSPSLNSTNVFTDNGFTRNNYVFTDYLSIGEAVPRNTSGCDCDIAKFIAFCSRDKFQLRETDITKIKDYLLTQMPD